MDPLEETLQREHSRGEFHLTRYWNIILKRQWLIAAAVFTALVVSLIISVFSQPTYRAVAVLNVEKDRAGVFEIGNRPVVAGQDPEFLPTQTRLMRSREVVDRVTEKLKGNAAFGRNVPTAAEIQNNSEAIPVRGTTLVELYYVGNSPQAAALVANTLADEYILWTMESRFAVVRQASQFLTTQIQQLKTEIEEKERQLQAYGRANDIISVDPQTNVTIQNLEALNRDYAAAVADRAAKQARYQELLRTPAEAVTDPSVSAPLRTELSKLEREYAEKLAIFKPDWPAMVQLKAQIERTRQHLDSVVSDGARKARDVAQSEFLMAQRREQNLRAVLQGQKSEAMALNTRAVPYAGLVTELETKRELFNKLLEQQAQTEVSSRLRGEGASTVQVVDRALPPPTRFRPSYRRNLINALFFGALIGVALAFLLEYLDRSLRTPEQVEQYLDLPALGVIPAIGSPAHGRYGYGLKRLRKKQPESEEHHAVELLPHNHPRTTGAEAYRAFRTSLLLSRAGGVRSIVITSSAPGEGKTSTALNLAVVLGQLGKRVLLIDADLHKPRLHELLRTSNRAGLVSILAENAAPGDLILKTDLPGVLALPSGPSSPNPSGLLASDAMGQLLEYATRNFDYVVIDTPPISVVADAILIGNQADGAVLCVSGGETPREQVSRMRDKLVRANVRILGVLINRLDEDPTGYGKYYHYYSDQRTYPTKTSHSGIA
jgi:succinoglycan biosynthesis transport protein ExoP